MMDLLREMRFAEPVWLLALLVLPLLVVRYRRQRPGSLQFSTLNHVHNLPASFWTRMRGVVFALKLIALAVIIMAMARPQSGDTVVDVTADGVDIILVLDVSSSSNDQVLCHVGSLVEISQSLPGNVVDRNWRPQDRASQGVSRPETLGEQLVDKIIRNILHHLYFLDDHFFFTSDVFIVKRRA